MGFPRVERRLFQAVLAVLGTGACELPAKETSKSKATPRDAGVAVAPRVIVDAAVPIDAAVVTIPPPRDVIAICADYVKKTRHLTTAAARNPPHSTPDFPRVVQPNLTEGPLMSAQWDPVKGLAICSIARDVRDGTVEVTRTPRCCPQVTAPGQAPHECPPSYTEQVQGTALVGEEARLRGDGTLVDKKSYRVAISEKNPPPPEPYCGRRPEGMQLLGDAVADDVGGRLAEMAELEAASIPAFARLARELAAHGAPHTLVARANAAMLDEIRHAQVMLALAAQYGAAPRIVTVPELPIRSLDEVAQENAVEGCVHEAYGALVATYQGERAEPALRSVFRRIARDERRHAALAEAVHAWIGDRAAESRTRACEQLRARLHDAPACETLGIPGGADAVALFDAYFAA